MLRNSPSSPRLSTEAEPTGEAADSRHTITASLETAFEVDKEVAAALKVALFRLSHLLDPGTQGNFDANFEESQGYRDQSLRGSMIKVAEDDSSLAQEGQTYNEVCGKNEEKSNASNDTTKLAAKNLATASSLVPMQNTSEKFANDQEMKEENFFVEGVETKSVAETSSEGENQTDSEKETEARDLKLRNTAKMRKQRQKGLAAHPPKRSSSRVNSVKQENANFNSLIDSMTERVKSLDPEQLSSLASIIATRGLNALLKEQNMEQDLNGKSITVAGLGETLVKHVSRLEAEKAKAIAAPRESSGETEKKLPSTEAVPDLGTILVKHVPKFRKEIQAAKESGRFLQMDSNKISNEFMQEQKGQSLDKLLVKHLSHLEREKLAASSASAAISSSSGTCTSKFVPEDYKMGLEEILKNANAGHLVALTENGDDQLPDAAIMEEQSDDCGSNPICQDYALILNAMEFKEDDQSISSVYSTASSEKSVLATSESSGDVEREPSSGAAAESRSDGVFGQPMSFLAWKPIPEEHKILKKKLPQISKYNNAHYLVKVADNGDNQPSDAEISKKKSDDGESNLEYGGPALVLNAMNLKEDPSIPSANIAAYGSSIEPGSVSSTEKTAHQTAKCMQISNRDLVEGPQDLGSILVKHVSKFERYMQASKDVGKEQMDDTPKRSSRFQNKQMFDESLDKVLVKRLSRLEKEKLAKLAADEGREIISENPAVVQSSQKAGLPIIVKHSENGNVLSDCCNPPDRHRPSEASSPRSQESFVERHNAVNTDQTNICPSAASSQEHHSSSCSHTVKAAHQTAKCRQTSNKDLAEGLQDLESILVKHVSKFERYMQAAKDTGNVQMDDAPKRSFRFPNKQMSDESLDKVLVKHLSRLEKEQLDKSAADEGREVISENPAVVQSSQEEVSSSNMKPSENGNVISDRCNPSDRHRPSEGSSPRSQESAMERHNAVNTEQPNICLPAASYYSAAENGHMQDLKQIGTKRLSRLDMEKEQARKEDYSQGRKSLKARQTNDVWGGMSLGNTLKRHISKLELGQTEAQSHLTSHSSSGSAAENGHTQDLEDIGVKRPSRLEMEEERARREDSSQGRKPLKARQIDDVWGGISLGNTLKRHISKLELEQTEALSHPISHSSSSSHGSSSAAENGHTQDLKDIGVKRLSRLEMEKEQARREDSSQGRKPLKSRQIDDVWGGMSLGNTLKPHVSKLEFEQVTTEAATEDGHTQDLKDIGVKRLSKLEMEKEQAGREDSCQGRKSLKSRQIDDVWGGMSLGNTLKRHVSKLELEQAAWKRAEEEARGKVSSSHK